MSIKKVVTAGFVAGSVALAIAGATTVDAKEGAEKEKCYGVVKASHNDCANASKTHSCMAQATVDGDGGEFIVMPKGVCEKLVGGSTAPMMKEDETHGHSDMKMEKEG